jgi:Mn2+/Fe2+ NRAMP family transporter
VLISMILMVNNKKIMGEYVNNTFQNVVGISTTVILIAMTGMLIVLPILSRVFNI